MAENPSEDLDLLRVRYADWCSAKISERIFELSLEELASRAEALRGESDAGPAPVLPVEITPGSGGYWDVVRALTTEIGRELNLPSFEEWSEMYQRDPAPFDRDLAGFSRTVDPQRT